MAEACFAGTGLEVVLRRSDAPAWPTRPTAKFTRVLGLFLCGAWFGCGLGQAAMVTKLNTSTLQPNATDWSAAPAPTDTGWFDNTLSAANAAALSVGPSPPAQLVANHETRRVLEFATPVTTDCLEIHLTASNELTPAALFEIRCYA
jgi:hypothetical protein